MKKILFILSFSLLSCGNSTQKIYKVEFNSGKIYRVKSVGFYHGHSGNIYFHGNQGMFPQDSIKSITVQEQNE